MSTSTYPRDPQQPYPFISWSTRVFRVHRAADTSGVSGTGFVLEGTILSSGKVVAQWMPDDTVSVFDSFDRFLQIHVYSHPENGTTIHYRDGAIWCPQRGELRPVAA